MDLTKALCTLRGLGEAGVVVIVEESLGDLIVQASRQMGDSGIAMDARPPEAWPTVKLTGTETHIGTRTL